MAKKLFSELKTGVIGAGSMGQNHARIYSELSNLIAISDPDEKQGRMVAERFGVEWISDFNKILDRVDAVSIAVPTVLHRDIAEAVAKKGVHILVEKPLAGNVIDAECIVETAKSEGITLAVGHIERHNPVIAYAKKAITDKKWGDLITMSSRRVSNYPSRIHDVGVLFDLLIHDIDICTYLANGPVTSVFATGGSMKSKHEDYVILVLEHKNGIISMCEANWLTPMKIRKLGITTSSHYIELDYQKQSVELFKSEYLKVSNSNLYSTGLEFNSRNVPIKKKEPLHLEIIDFLSSITNKKDPLVTGQEGLNIVKISEAALASLTNKKAVLL